MPSISQPGRVASDKISKSEVLDAITSDNQTFDGANIDAAVSSRAAPADAGVSATEIIDTDISGQASLTINEAGLLHGVSKNWGFPSLRFQHFISSRSSWVFDEQDNQSDGDRVSFRTISAGDGDVRLKNEDQTTRDVRVVKLA